MWMSMGQWKKVVDKTSPFTAGDPTLGNQGYGYVLILKAFAYHGIQSHLCAYQGMAHEGLDNFDVALHNYVRAAQYIHRSSPSTKHYAIQHWISVILYRLSMLSLRLLQPMEAIENFRRYKVFVENNFGNQVDFQDRLTVYYWYWRTLSDEMKSRPKPTDSTYALSTQD
jgi:hypothetical protein